MISGVGGGRNYRKNMAEVFIKEQQNNKDYFNTGFDAEKVLSFLHLFWYEDIY